MISWKRCRNVNLAQSGVWLILILVTAAIMVASTTQSFQFPWRQSSPPDHGCEQYELQGTRKYSIKTNIFNHHKPPPYIANDITMIVHLTADRLDRLKTITLHWPGPISAAIYVARDTIGRTIEQLKPLKSRSNLYIHFLIMAGTIYPSNILRNVALEQVFTEYVFLNDIDFMPAFHLYQTALDFIQNTHPKRPNATEALIVPAFAIQDSQSVPETLFPKNKKELISLWKAKEILPFDYLPTEFYGHLATKFDVWIDSTDLYKVDYVDLFEPYVIVRTCEIPRYNNTFVGRYYDKSSQFMELNETGYSLWVLPDVFIIHLPHPKQAPDIKLYECAHKQMLTFKQDLKVKYAASQRKMKSCPKTSNDNAALQW